MPIIYNRDNDFQVSTCLERQESTVMVTIHNYARLWLHQTNFADYARKIIHTSHEVMKMIEDHGMCVWQK